MRLYYVYIISNYYILLRPWEQVDIFPRIVRALAGNK